MHMHKIVATFGAALSSTATKRIVTLSYTDTRHTHTYICVYGKHFDTDFDRNADRTASRLHNKCRFQSDK